MSLRFAVALAVTTLLLALPRAAAAFCGFYVSGADGKLFANATQVVMMREGTRTVRHESASTKPIASLGLPQVAASAATVCWSTTSRASCPRPPR